MKTFLKLVVPFVLLAAILVAASCKKKQVYIGEPPTIAFKTGGNYYAANDTVTAGDTVLIGINATDNNSPDKLAQLVIRKKVNENDKETIKDIRIPEGQNTSYSADFKFVLVTEGTQVYTFIVTNTHGLQTEKTITFTVSQ